MSITSAPKRARALGPSPAVAPPPGNPRFPLVDSLRGIAVLCVVLYHVTGISGAMNAAVTGDVLAVLGTVGVVIFFVVSGFLLYRPFAAGLGDGRGPPSVRRYARRRVLRIVPAYWTALTVLAVAPGVVGAFSGEWWRYYLFLQNTSSTTIDGGIPPAWTLAVEVSFYVLLPVWALLVRGAVARIGRERRLIVELALLAGTAAISVLVQVAASRLWISNLWSTALPGEWVWFTLGMALAVVSVDDAHRASRRRVVTFVQRHPGACWLGSVACLLGLAAVLHDAGVINLIRSLATRQPYARTLAGAVLTAGVAGLLVAPAVLGQRDGPSLPRRVLASRGLTLLGLISYGVYLWHLTFAELIGQGADPARFSATGWNLVARLHHFTTPVLLALTLVTSVAAATLSYRLIELRFLRLKD